jgi:N-acyl-L-homoserine lactone synthetase
MSKLVVGTRDELGCELYHRALRYRYDIFVRRLRWTLPCDHHAGEEADAFDTPQTVHVVSANDEGMVDGYCRLLPTTQPHLMQSVFPHLVEHALWSACSPAAWELSRLAASPPFGGVTGRLLLEGAIEAVSARGGTRLVGVLSRLSARFFEQIGISIVALGAPATFNGSTIFAGAIAIASARKELGTCSSSTLLMHESSANHSTRFTADY